MVLAQRFGAVADFALARQEHQHVARADAAQLFHAIDDGIHQVALFARGGRALARLVGIRARTRHGHLFALHGTVAHFHLVQAARHFDHGRRFFRRAEMARKALGVDGGRGDDDFQVGPARQQLFQIAEQEIDVQAAFMRFIDDDGVVIFQQRIGLRLGQQDTVRHQLDGCATAQGIGKTHLETHRFAQWRAQFLRDALGRRRGGDAPWLRMADHALLAPSQFQANLRQLRRLAGPRLARDDDDLVFHQGLGDFGAPARDGQVFRIGNRWQRIAERLFRLARGARRVAGFAAFTTFPVGLRIARRLSLARRTRRGWPLATPACALLLLLPLLLFRLLRARTRRPLLAHGRTPAFLRRRGCGGRRRGGNGCRIGHRNGHIRNVGRRGRLIAG